MIVKGLRIGTRTSRLARAQTGIVIEMLRTKFPALEIEVVPVTTMGDRLPDEKRAEVEGKGAFTEDLEALLQKGEVDAAVHSMKDLPTKLGGGLAIAATPVRADPRDALVSSHGLSLAEMPEGAVVGTSSIRRKAQLMALRSDIELVDLHGNVETRLRRMGERESANVLRPWFRVAIEVRIDQIAMKVPQRYGSRPSGRALTENQMGAPRIIPAAITTRRISIPFISRLY